MLKFIKILLLEDEQHIKALIERLLEQEGFDASVVLSQNRKEFINEIAKPEFDLIISDYSLPNFDGLTALSLLRKKNQDIPFILFSGSIGEEMAIESLRQGATDYVLKQNINALVPAIKRALKEVSRKKKELILQKALAQSEALHYSTIQSLPSAVLVSAPHGQIIMVNKTFSEILDIDAEDVVDKIKIDQLEPILNTQINKFFSNLYIKNQNFDFESPEIITASGRKIYLQCRGLVNKDNSDKVVSLLVILGDITRRKQTEIKLKESEEQYRFIMQAAADAIISINSDGNIISWNEAAEKIFGYSISEIINKNLSIIIPTKYRYGHLTGIERLKNGCEEKLIGKTIELVARYKDGTEFPIELSISRWSRENEKFYTGIIRDITERKKVEQTIEQYSTLFKDSLNEIYIFDATSYKFVDVNKAAQNNLGYNMEELSQLTAINIRPDFDKKSFDRFVKPLKSGRSKKLVFNTLHVRKDGTRYDVEVHLQFSDFKDKKVFIAMVLDTTDRRHSEKSQHVIFRITSAGLKTTHLANIYAIIQLELGQLIDTTNFFIGIYQKENDTLLFPYMEDENDQFNEVPAANTISSYVINNNKSLLLCGKEVDAFIETNKINRLGSPAKCWLGVPLLVQDKTVGLIVVQSYKDENAYTKKDLEVVEFIADQINSVILKEQIESQLKSMTRQNEQLITSLPSILIVMDKTEQVIRWNSAAEHSFDIMKENVIGKKLLETGIQWDWASIVAGIEKCRTENRTTTLNEIGYETPGKKYGFLNITISPFTSKTELSGFLILAKDITEHKIMESQLSQAQKLESIGQLAAGIAHEINTPTQFVGDNTSFLKDAFSGLHSLIKQFTTLKEIVKINNETAPILEKTNDLIEEIDLDYLLEEVPLAIEQSLEGINRISNIVRAMKEFSHPGAKEKTPIDINKSILNTTTVCKNEWKYVSDIVTELDESLPPVPCIPDAFNQVILNLIINAAHAITDSLNTKKEEKGLIKISTAKIKNMLEIRIKDSGSGIPEKVQDKIFDPFFTTKEVGKGTGQGLAISHDVITKKHNGTIEFETALNKGTTFIIRLPLN
jgi:PAS domain S-box-containing protein